MPINLGTNLFAGSPVAVALTDENGNAILAKCTTANLPQTAAGYAVGCQIVATDTGVLYRNLGSVASSVFMTGSTSSTITSLGTVQNSTPTTAQLQGGIVTQTSATGAGTITLPTGTQLSAANPNVAVGYRFNSLFANLGGTFTLTVTGQTGSTVIGNGAIPTGKNADLVFVNTGTNTWNVYVNVSA